MNEPDEVLLDVLLGVAPEEQRDGLDPEQREALSELESALARARRGAEQARAADWSPIREGALVGRVLARTTREDLSWRGDLQLVASFVRERVAASPVLKLVAASLLVHLIALPVVGWYVLREPERRPTLYMGPPLQTEEAFLDVPEEEGETLAPGLDADVWLAGRVENARRRARYSLSLPVDVVVAPDEEPLEIRLLALRTGAPEGADAERWGSWLDDEVRFARADRLQRVLWIDVLLDRNVVTGQHSPVLRAGLNRLALAAGNASADAETPPPAAARLGRLERLALERARSYGLWEAGTGFDPLAVPPPFDPTWCADLGAALAERGLDGHPVWRALGRRCAP